MITPVSQIKTVLCLQLSRCLPVVFTTLVVFIAQFFTVDSVGISYLTGIIVHYYWQFE